MLNKLRFIILIEEVFFFLLANVFVTLQKKLMYTKNKFKKSKQKPSLDIN